MRFPRVQTLGLMARAAELRAAGLYWPEVADRVGRHQRTLRNWCSRHKQIWRGLLAAAQKNLLREIRSAVGRRLDDALARLDPLADRPDTPPSPERPFPVW